ncbi:MAG: MotA/TolQ/ExbB proton channel family protein [Candidatus Binatia bacterium]
MIPIIILSVIALAIVLTKFWTLWRFRKQANTLWQRLSPLVREGHLSSALRLSQEHNSALGRLFETAILYRHQERTELTHRLERSGAEIVAGLESHLGALATITGVEPMLGFLGTIIGLIQAFMQWETMGDTITINALAGGIYQAMITTAAGLSVAIPYYLIHNHLVTRVGVLTRFTEERAEEFVDMLSEAATVKEPTRHAL